MTEKSFLLIFLWFVSLEISYSAFDYQKLGSRRYIAMPKPMQINLSYQLV